MRMRLDISRASLNLCRGGFPEVFSNILPCGLGHLDGIDVREGCVVSADRTGAVALSRQRPELGRGSWHGESVAGESFSNVDLEGAPRPPPNGGSLWLVGRKFAENQTEMCGMSVALQPFRDIIGRI